MYHKWHWYHQHHHFTRRYSEYKIDTISWIACCVVLLFHPPTSTPPYSAIPVRCKCSVNARIHCKRQMCIAPFCKGTFNQLNQYHSWTNITSCWPTLSDVSALKDMNIEQIYLRLIWPQREQIIWKRFLSTSIGLLLWHLSLSPAAGAWYEDRGVEGNCGGRFHTTSESSIINESQSISVRVGRWSCLGFTIVSFF